MIFFYKYNKQHIVTNTNKKQQLSHISIYIKPLSQAHLWKVTYVYIGYIHYC